MNDAVLGFTGVVVGALVSGGATIGVEWWRGRQADRASYRQYQLNILHELRTVDEEIYKAIVRMVGNPDVSDRAEATYRLMDHLPRAMSIAGEIDDSLIKSHQAVFIGAVEQYRDSRTQQDATNNAEALIYKLSAVAEAIGHSRRQLHRSPTIRDRLHVIRRGRRAAET